MPKLKVTGRQCSACGSPIQDRNTYGICVRNIECKRLRSEARRRAAGITGDPKPRRTCSVDGCSEPHVAKDYCSRHWSLNKKYGDPGPVERLRKRVHISAGERFGSWVALEDYVGDLLLCRCSCGNERLMSPRILKQLALQADCRCEMLRGRPVGRPPSERLAGRVYLEKGRVFGMLTALETAYRERQHVLCQCECGKTSTPWAGSLRRGDTTSCGCRGHFKHGLCKHPLYHIWYGITRRCNNPHDKAYPGYGGRGITICERWSGLPDGLLNFAADMGPRPSPQHSVDRQDVHAGYASDNCVWATPEEQNRNKRKVGDLTSERDALQAQVEELTAALAMARGALF